MTTDKLSKLWTLVTILLVITIIGGGVLVWAQFSESQPVEISISIPSQEQLSYIYLSGAVTNPGLYPLRAGDSVEALIQAAGGTTTGTDPVQLKLYVSGSGDEEQPQKININRAEAWLLQALPGIGEIRAQAIIDYRRQNGLFHNISELTKVEGISISIYEKIKELIAVAD